VVVLGSRCLSFEPVRQRRAAQGSAPRWRRGRAPPVPPAPRCPPRKRPASAVAPSGGAPRAPAPRGETGAAHPAPSAPHRAPEIQNATLSAPDSRLFDPDQRRHLSLTAPHELPIIEQRTESKSHRRDAHRFFNLKCSGIDRRCIVCRIGARIGNREMIDSDQMRTMSGGAPAREGMGPAPTRMSPAPPASCEPVTCGGPSWA